VPSRSAERSSAERDVTNGLADELRTYERLVEVSRERYTTEMELSAAQARLAQLDATAGRAKQAFERLRNSFRAAYRDPDRALISFLTGGGPAQVAVVRDLQEKPEQFGELRSAERTELMGRSRGDDAGAREAARSAAAAARELIEAEQALRSAIARARNGRQPSTAGADVDEAEDARTAARRDIEGGQDRLRKLREEEQRAPGFHLLERALARGLWELSPPEFNRLRLVVTGAQFSLARKLRQIAHDAALGRDDEM